MNKPARILRNENNKFEEKLSKETNDVLTDIVVYIRSKSISEYDQERVRRDIDEMLFEGERRGMSAAEIIGDDYKAFCDAVMREVPKLSKAQRVMTAVQEVLAGVIVLLAIWTVFSPIIQLIKKEPWYLLPLRLSDLITATVIVAAAVLIVVYITKNVFTPKPAALTAGFVLAAAIGIAGILFCSDIMLMNIHIAVDIALLAVLALVYLLIGKRLE